MGLAVITPPSEEPVSLTELKAHLRVDSTDDDAYITSLGKAGREWVESYCHRQLVTATWDLRLDKFSSEFLLPLPELQSVTSIKYIDTDGVTQTVTGSTYVIDTDQEPGRIRLAYDKSWPDDRRSEKNGVTIRFVAGYGAASAVPDQIKAALFLYTGHLYEHREAVTIGRISRILELGLTRLLVPFALLEV